MRVLNIEDDTFKHNDICKALSECGIKDIEWSNNLADGWKQIKNTIDSNNPYDLIITDIDRKSTRLNSSHSGQSRMPSSA